VEKWGMTGNLNVGGRTEVKETHCRSKRERVDLALPLDNLLRGGARRGERVVSRYNDEEALSIQREVYKNTTTPRHVDEH